MTPRERIEALEKNANAFNWTYEPNPSGEYDFFWLLRIARSAFEWREHVRGHGAGPLPICCVVPHLEMLRQAVDDVESADAQTRPRR